MSEWIHSYLSVQPAICLMLISIQFHAPIFHLHLQIYEWRSVVSVQRGAVQAADGLFTLAQRPFFQSLGSRSITSFRLLHHKAVLCVQVQSSLLEVLYRDSEWAKPVESRVTLWQPLQLWGCPQKCDQ